jgi:hypothetical protein
MLQEMGVATVVEQGPDFVERLFSALLGALEPQSFDCQVRTFSTLRGSNALVTIGDHLEMDIRGKRSGN